MNEQVINRLILGYFSSVQLSPFQKPNDIAYVYSGYGPILVRLCQYLYKPGWKSLQEILKKLPGSSGTQEQSVSEQHSSLIKS